MPTGDRIDPYRVYYFQVELDGINRAGFRECSGLDTSQDPIEYREGTEGLTARKLPGLVKYSNISLKCKPSLKLGGKIVRLSSLETG